MAFKAVGEASRFAWALLLILVARRLGDEAFGRISFAYSFTSVFVLATDLGLGVLLIREAARARDEAPRLFGNILSFKLISSPLTLGLIAVAILLSGYPPEVVAVVLLFAGINLLRGVLDLYGALFSGLEVMEREAFLRNLHQIGLLLAGAGALALGCGPTGIATALLLASLLLFIVGSVLVGRTVGRLRLLWEGTLWLDLLRKAFPLGLTVVFIVLSNEGDVVLLSFLGRAESEVGWYAAASKILKMLQVFPMLVVSGIYPVFSDLAARPSEGFAKAYQGVFKLLLLAAVPAAIAVSGFSEPLIRLIYGPRFLPAAVPLRILACSIPFLFLGYLLINVLVSSDHQGKAALATGGAATLILVSDLLLIPAWGMTGAAVGALVGQVGLVLLAGFWAERGVVHSRLARLAPKPLLAGIVMFGAVVMLGPVRWALALPAALGAYLLVLILAGGLREEEVEAVRRIWRQPESKGILRP